MRILDNKTMKTAILLAAITGLGACATAPKQTDEAAKLPPPAPVEKPVFTEPDPAPVAQREPAIIAPVAEALPENYVVPGSVEDFVAAAGDRVFFGYDQSTLTSQARDILRAQANWMNSYPQVIAVIGGHADERGTREYNLSLGEKRASAVKDFLVSQGVDPGRITTVSYGKERPIAGGSDEQSWALNRNGHTAIVAGANS